MKSTLSHKRWLELRRGIGGSDAAAVCGLSRWKTPLTVYLEKIGERIPNNKINNEYIYWEKILKDVVAREFEKRTNLKVRKVRKVNHVIYHKIHPFMVANIERKIANEDALLECKTASQFHEDEWKDGKIPKECLLQVHHYLAVTGFSHAYIAALIGGHTYIAQKVDRDPEIIDYLVKIESEFWHMVETRTPPAIDGSEESIRLLNLLFAQDTQQNQSSKDLIMVKIKKIYYRLKELYPNTEDRKKVIKSLRRKSNVKSLILLSEKQAEAILHDLQ